MHSSCRINRSVNRRSFALDLLIDACLWLYFQLQHWTVTTPGTRQRMTGAAGGLWLFKQWQGGSPKVAEAGLWQQTTTDRGTDG